MTKDKDALTGSQENREEERAPGGLTYRDAGVDIEQAKLAKRRIRELARTTFNDSVVQGLGAFAGLFRPDFGQFDHPLLVASADGVGTKLKIAFLTGIHNTVGVDLVSHCCNDILAQRALPMFFLDYIAAGVLDPGVVEQIAEGLSVGCRQAGCALLGGETAEMPDFYQQGEYDLAGFIVGMADEARIFRSEKVEAGDILIGLPSSGLHTNGFSLVRRLCFKRLQLTVESYVPELQKTLGEELLIPHRNYIPALRDLLYDPALRGLAHITGGGLTENLDRVLPAFADALVERSAWQPPPIFHFLQERGKIDPDEMYRTFNMGVGMVLVVARGSAERVERQLDSQAETHFRVGEVKDGGGKVRYR
ncbi:MAG: phosphoribosylformylglycinamidine cyclo-ligase [Acidobacteriota bacterium]